MLSSALDVPKGFIAEGDFLMFMSTIKQKRVAKKILENPRLSVGEAMRESGYSPNTAVHPKDLTDSKGWKKLMDDYLPDELLAQVGKEGLQANKQLAARVIFRKDAPTSQSAGELPLATSSTDDFIEVPDHAVRHKYWETSLKIKGKLTNNIDIKSDGEKIEPMQIVIIEDIKK